MFEMGGTNIVPPRRGSLTSICTELMSVGSIYFVILPVQFFVTTIGTTLVIAIITKEA